MPIITADMWSAWSNIPLADGSPELLSVQVICGQVDRSIKTKLKRFVEQQTFTDLIFDAPDTPYINLGRYAPITISSFQCWLNSRAQGNPLSFTADSLLTMYSDYALDTDPGAPGFSPGSLRRIGTIWGQSYRRRGTQLAWQHDPNYGAVKLTFQGGYPVIPADIIEAACLAVSMTLSNRKYGYNIGSESWNGYSYNIPGVGLMVNGIMGNPDIMSLLNSYINREAEVG